MPGMAGCRSNSFAERKSPQPPFAKGARANFPPFVKGARGDFLSAKALEGQTIRHQLIEKSVRTHTILTSDGVSNRAAILFEL